VTPDVGLRERKKAATRLTLSQAAIRLAVERGVGNVTADAIAEAFDRVVVQPFPSGFRTP
jgi:AcrR family transcriptional regulator